MTERYQPRVPRDERYYVPVRKGRTPVDRNVYALSKLLSLAPHETTAYITDLTKGRGQVSSSEMLETETAMHKALRQSTRRYFRDNQDTQPPMETNIQIDDNLRATEKHLHRVLDLARSQPEVSPALFNARDIRLERHADAVSQSLQGEMPHRRLP